MIEANIRFYGANWYPDYRHSKAFLGQHRVRYQDFDIDQDTNAYAYVMQQNDNKLVIPTILICGWPNFNGTQRRGNGVTDHPQP